MKKVLFLLVALVMAISGGGLPAAAADEPVAVTDATAMPVRAGLAINAPKVVQVGERVRIQVTEKKTGKPVTGAGLWAVSFRDSDNNLVSASSIESLQETGIFLGWSGDNGEVVSVFKEAGRYLLVTFKDGYLPGFAWTSVHLLKQLAIRAPESAGVGEPVTVTVYASPEVPAASSLAPVVVPGAGVWAVIYDNMTPVGAEEDTIAADAQKRGIFLGYTNDRGQVQHKFEKEGNYLLVAVKDGYKPGRSKIIIDREIKTLVIRAPEAVKILEPVKIMVAEQSLRTVIIPVPKVAVWAIRIENDATLDITEDESALAKKRGILLGYTDEQGFVNPAPQFRQAGVYRLVAIKDGYKPGYSKIVVKGPVLAPAIPVPQSSREVQAIPAARPNIIGTIKNILANPGPRVEIEVNRPSTPGIKAVK